MTSADKSTVIVRALTAQRHAALKPCLLYEETLESQLAREKRIQEKKCIPTFTSPPLKGRPAKKWRRQLHCFERNNMSTYRDTSKIF
jgi:ribosome-associated heat shock protein Hsp15